jgi:hypothetical protein
MPSATKTSGKDFEWRITRIKSTPAAYVGRVHAPDAQSAIKKVIVEFEITDREHQKRLVARRVGYSFSRIIVGRCA